MSCKPSKNFIYLIIASLLFTGCFPTQPMYLRDQGGVNLAYYLDQATAIEYPDVQTSRLEEVSQTQAPITVVDPEFRQFYDLSLEQCVSIALQNSKVIRGYGTPSLQGTRVSPGIDNLTTSPAGAGTFYDVAVRETEPGFIGTPGQLQPPGTLLSNTGVDANQGVEAALADFDAQFTSSLFWSNSDEPRNTVAPFDRTAFRQNQVTMQNEIAKKTAEGTLLFFRNSNVYTANNIPLASDPVLNGFQILPAWWRTSLEMEFRQPLMRGRGAFINRMPIVISRLGTDQSIANIEAQLQNMVTNIEVRYWDLQCAYRNLEAAKEGRDAALETWRIVKDQFDEKADVNIQQVSQAKEQYHFFDEQVIDAYNTLLTAESDLRYLLGIAQSDCQIIRPTDEPVLAPLEFDWCASLDEALLYRPELRQQMVEIKKKELAVHYAKNSLLPVVNVTGLYRWLGLGDKLASYEDGIPNFPAEGSGALNELWEGSYQEFQLGLDYRVPVGLRRELSNVINAEVKLARERARLEDMELDVTRELTATVRALAANRRIMQSSFNRWAATSVEENHFKELANEGVETLDVALDAQRRRAQAEVAFYTALCEYNKVIALMHRRKGTILAYNGIAFGEGPWPGKAYQDASELARKRSASREVNYGWTRPGVVSQGTISPPLNSGTSEMSYEGNYLEEIYPGDGEVISTPYYQTEEPFWGGDQSIPNNTPEMIMEEGEIIMPNEIWDFGSQVTRDDQVQTASYSASDSSKSARRELLSTWTNGTPDSRTAPQAIRPARDSLTAPVPQAGTQPKASVQNVDWAKFGLSQPNLNDGNVDARIKTGETGGN